MHGVRRGRWVSGVAASALLAAGLGAASSARPAAAGSGSATLAPVGVTIEHGSAVGGLAAVQAIDGSTLQLGPGVTRSYLTYQLPAGVSAAAIWALTVKANVVSPIRKQQRWSWFVRNFTTRRWTRLGDNIEVGSASPYTLRFYPAGPFTPYVSPTGALEVRAVSANKPSTLSLDAEWIELSYGSEPAFAGWKPAVGTRWQYQLQPPVDTGITAVPWTGGAPVRPEVFDIDLYEADGTTPAAGTVDAIHAEGAHAICYVDAGTWEDWRPDAAAYPAAVRGARNGWPGERWVDIRRLDVLLPIIDARVQRCAAAGFDAVEYDNVEAVFNHSGFPVSPAQQVEFDRALADVAHAHGLAVGLKNDIAQLTQLEPWFEFAVNEQCQQYKECDGYDAWIARGKAVAQVEYSTALSTFCRPAIAAGRSAIRKALALLATPYTPCN